MSDYLNTVQQAIGRVACTCQGRATCNTCQYFANVYRYGVGFRALPTGGTIEATPAAMLGLVCRNTFPVAVATPTDKRGFITSQFIGFGRGASVRKADGVATGTLRTPRPPYALRSTKGGFPIFPVGA